MAGFDDLIFLPCLPSYLLLLFSPHFLPSLFCHCLLPPPPTALSTSLLSLWGYCLTTTLLMCFIMLPRILKKHNTASQVVFFVLIISRSKFIYRYCEEPTNMILAHDNICYLIIILYCAVLGYYSIPMLLYHLCTYFRHIVKKEENPTMIWAH